MPEYEYQVLPIDQILPNPLKPRFDSSRKEILELAESIRQYGLFTPLLIGKTAIGMQIIAGERRWRAAKIAGLKEIPAMITEASSIEFSLLFLEENLQRKSLNLIEQAKAITSLLRKDGFTIKIISSGLKINAPEIQRILSVLDLPQKIQEAYLNGDINDAKIYALLEEEDPLVALYKTKA